MDSWKGEKLHGADRKLTRAQLEAIDRVVLAVSKAYAATAGKGWDKVLEALTPGR